MPSARLSGPTVAILAVTVMAHLACIDRFGWFRDELYYLACGEHLALGYVDHPPLIGWVAAGSRWLGGSFLAVRAPSLLAGLGTLVVTDRLAERLGAGSAGRALSVLAVALAPIFLFQFHTLSMNSFEILIGTSAAWVGLDLDSNAPRSRWIVFGALVGLGVLNKHGMLFWVLASGSAFLLSGRHRLVTSPGPWWAALIALALILPHVAWQFQHGLPTLEFYRNAQELKVQPMTLAGFAGAQVTLAGPGNALVWWLGLGWLLAAPGARPFRWLGTAYLLLFAWFVLMRGKAYYLLPFYPVLFAAGGAALTHVTRAVSPRRGRALVWVLATVELALGLATLPLALPILSVDATIAWGRRIGITPPKAERTAIAELPQHFADMFGWESLVETLARVRAALPANERGTARVLAGNYGEAAAVDWLGGRHGLPRAASPHNAYWTWGPPDGEPLIVVGAGGRLVPERFWREVETKARTRCEHCMPHERDRPVYVVRGWKQPRKETWAALRTYR